MNHWRPETLAGANGHEFKVVRLLGEFLWHDHAEADEVFLGVSGRVRIEFRDGVVEVGPGDLVVVPRGVEHRPVAEEEATVLVIEPEGVVNTGDVYDDRLTAPRRQ